MRNGDVMGRLEEKSWQETSNRIRALLTGYRMSLPNSTVEAVEHYLNHDEYEMAPEGLCIDLMEQSDDQEVDWAECVDLCQSMGLHKESSFDPTFWARLVKRLPG
jgi:hypothetical protein